MMKKRIVSFGLIYLLVIMTIMPVFAVENDTDNVNLFDGSIERSLSDNGTDNSEEIIISGNCGENTSYILYDNGVFEVSGYGPIDNLTFMGYPGWNMEYGDLVKKIVIKDGVTEVGDWYFRNLSNVTSIQIPDSIERIGEGAFAQCWHLPSIEIPDSVKSIGKYAFTECMRMETIKLSNSLKKIDEATFYHCDALKYITIPSTVSSIEKFAFCRCQSLLYVDIPESVTKVARYAFGICNNLQLVRVYSDSTEFDFEAYKKSNAVCVVANNSAKVKDICTENKIEFKTDFSVPNPTEYIDSTEDGMMGFGSVEFWTLFDFGLNKGNYEKYIDRVNPDMEGYDVVRGIYDSLVEASDNDGNNDYLITLPQSKVIYEKYVGGDNKEEIERVYSNLTSLAYLVFRNDHPEVFWFDSMVTSSGINEDGYYVVSCIFEEMVSDTFSTPDKIRAAIAECNETLEEIKQTVSGNSTFEQIRYVNKWIADNTEYNTLIRAGSEPLDTKVRDTFVTAYSVLAKQKGEEGPVCDGYAKGLKMICDYLDIPCAYEYGNTTEGPHAWNVVCIDSNWYYIDTTWNTTDLERWFLCGRNSFTFDHIVDDNGGFENGPIVAETDYDFGQQEITPTPDPITHVHNLEEIIERKATCTEDGNIAYWYCEACGKYFKDAEAVTEVEKEQLVLPALGHVSVSDNALPATCTEAGKTEGSHCSRCGETLKEQEVLPAKGHTEVKDEAEVATCTKEGLTEGKHCSVCKEVLVKQEIIKATGHKWDNGTITKEATATEDGVKTFKCTHAGCAETKTEAIPKTGEKPGQSTEDQPQIGETVTDQKTDVTYTVTESEGEDKTVTYTQASDDAKGTVKVPETVIINDTTYKVTKIEDKAFAGNKKITKVTIGSNITEIGAGAFSGCSKLKTVTVGSKVTQIDSNAFKGCTSLTKVTLPAKTTKIGANAFNGCKKIKTITIKSTKLTDKSISKNAFKGLQKGTTIKVPKKKLSAYQKLFKKKGLSSKVKITA